jgi:biopolymer transport protein ExbB
MKLGKLGAWCWGCALVVILGLSLTGVPALAQEVGEPAAAEATEEAAPVTATETPAAEGGEEQSQQYEGSGLVELFNKGGNFMWPLLFLAVLGLAVILERLFTLQRAHTNTRRLMSAIIQSLKSKGVDAAKDICMHTRGPIAAILHAGLTKVEKGPAAVEKAIANSGAIEMSFLQRGMPILSTVANIAPLLGFLGTVSGMINAFEAIAAAEQVSAKVVASGISEALITTMSGLVIAIPVQAAYNFFTARIDGFVIEMEESSVELIDALTEEA